MLQIKGDIKIMNLRLFFTGITISLLSFSAHAGTFYQSDENAPVVEGVTAQAQFQAAAGTLTEVNFDGFTLDQVLTGNEFLASGITLQGIDSGGTDPDVPITPFPGVTRCVSVDDGSGANAAGTLFVVDSTSTSRAGDFEASFTTPVRSVGVSIALDPEGGDNRTMEIYGPGNVLIDTSPLEIFDDSDNLTSAYVGWIGSGTEVATRILITNDVDGMSYCSIEFSRSNPTDIPSLSNIGIAVLLMLLMLWGLFGRNGNFAGIKR